jgi:hypothetical protein
LHSSASTPTTSPAVVSSLINTSYIANINDHYWQAFPALLLPLLFVPATKLQSVRSYSRCLPWINSNVMTSFLTALLPIAMVCLQSYCFPTSILIWQQVHISGALSRNKIVGANSR